MKLPIFYSYGGYSSDNYGLNSVCIVLPGIRLYYSYQTIVAFHDYGGEGLIVSENLWGPTTGKHLNKIESDHLKRVPREDFELRLTNVLLKLGYTD